MYTFGIMTDIPLLLLQAIRLQQLYTKDILEPSYYAENAMYWFGIVVHWYLLTQVYQANSIAFSFWHHFGGQEFYPPY